MDLFVLFPHHQIRGWMPGITAQLLPAPSVTLFASEAEAETQFRNVSGDSKGICGINFSSSSGTNYSYSIRMNYDDMPGTETLLDSAKGFMIRK